MNWNKPRTIRGRQTKAAMDQIKQEIKEKGQYVTKAGKVITKLGNPNMPLRYEVMDRRVETRLASADAFALKIYAIIQEIRAEGVTSYYGIAQALKDRRVLTAHGSYEWHRSSVMRIIKRVEQNIS